MDKERTELIRRIASVVGHELRNPLAVIGNSAYFVRTKLAAAKDKDAKVEKHLGIIASEIARADRLIADMLAFSRPLELRLSSVEPAAVVAAALAACAPPAGVKVRREGAAPPVRADAGALIDALRRILENAVESMGGAGELVLSCAIRGESVIIEVRDSGPGFSDEARAQAPHPFFTTKPRGLGLGLAVAAKAAAAHGGSLRVDNASGGGAVVALSLPKA